MDHVKEGARQIAAGGSAGNHTLQTFATLILFRVRGSMLDAPIGRREDAAPTWPCALLESFGCVQKDVPKRYVYRFFGKRKM